MEKFNLPKIEAEQREENRSKEIEKAPHGWKTNKAVSVEFSVAGSTVKKIANKYRSNDDYFKNYKNAINQINEHYSPELISLISEEIKQQNEEIPEGWIVATNIAKELHIDPKTVQGIVEKYKETNPDFFKRYIRLGKIREYFSPELIKIIRENKNLRTAPEGWKVISKIASENEASIKTIKKIIDKYRATHPSLFSMYRDGAGHDKEHLAPELEKMVVNDLKEISYAPDGWMTSTALYELLNVPQRTIAGIAKNYKNNFPDYFQNYKDKIGRMREHYSPELIQLIKEKREEINKISTAPTGWQNQFSLAKKFNVHIQTLQAFADQYKTTNPEYFQNFKNTIGKISEHYSPELISILENKFKELPDFAPMDWKVISRISSEINFPVDKIKNISKPYRETNPEYFANFRDGAGQEREYFSPEIISIIKNEIGKEKFLEIQKDKQVQPAPEGWLTNLGLAKKLGVSKDQIYRIVDEYREEFKEYFSDFRGKNGHINEHYSPELVKIITDRARVFENVSQGWKTNQTLANELMVDSSTTRKIADHYKISNPDFFKKLKSNTGVYEHFSPELVKIIESEVNQYKKIPEAPNDWKTIGALAKELVTDSKTVNRISNEFRETNKDFFVYYRDKFGRKLEYLSPELIRIISNEIAKNKETPFAPDGWITNNTIAIELGVAPKTINNITEQYRESHPEYFSLYKSIKGSLKNQIFEYLSPDLINIIKKEIENFGKPPVGWKTNHATANLINDDINQYQISKFVEPYRETNPEYFANFRDGTGKPREHYSPELVKIIQQEAIKFKQIGEELNKKELLKINFENFAQEIADPETKNEQAKKIGEILRLLPGSAHDIILRYHPEYKGINVGYVKKIIADYLGDFMMVRKEWKVEDIEKFKDIIDIKNIREPILSILKNTCLDFVNKEKKNNPNIEESELVEQYFSKPEIIKATSIPEIESAIQELKEYYHDIFVLREKKPGNIAEGLKEGRIFPDINQLLNIKEMQDKKKMLIADEMGLGKSASAILTKEYLGLKCAVVIVPSNVVDTWEDYLSDHVDENGKQVGYFKNKLAPKVLAINSPNDLEKLKTEIFDYVLISQERIAGENYGEALKNVDFDMMIVDEVHKIKNIESGVRSQGVLELSEKIQGKHKYLTLLSGTPIPNKVKDIAVSLKLLYPEKYKEFGNKEMVNRILYGDLIDLRTELLMRMQMKELATSIEMPKLKEDYIYINLSVAEREIYEILLEEDELTASQKIILFRQFLLNPELLNIEPGFEGSKVKKLEETLNEDLKTQDKIIVFVNGYVEGVIRGEQNIINKLNLPDDVVIEEIHGEVENEERKRIEGELKTGNKKMVVFVGGQTADVGVDFSGADGVIFYNEPWSKYDKKQQQARVYREGLKHDLVSKTLITRSSIEEGIRRYINLKEKAVEKLLKGIQNTDAEKKLLRKDSDFTGKNIEINDELSKEYISDWDKLMLHFGEGFESGEKKFKEELDRKGKEYADLYRKLGRLTYQGNNARVTATILENMIDERSEKVEDLRILDIASGPEMLKEASGEKLKERIFSMDINKEHFIPAEMKTKRIVASYLNLPAKDNSVDYCNLGFAFHQTSPIKYYKKNYERLQVLAEMNRVLKPGGRAVISMLHNIKFENEEKFNELVESLGLKVVSGYSGEATGGTNYKSTLYTLEKVEDIPEYKTETEKYVELENPRNINGLAERIGDELLEGLEMEKLPQGKSRLKDQRRMIEKIEIDGKEVKIIFNEKDGELFEREVQSIKDGEALKEKYGGIANIPIDEIKAIGFERKLETPGYFLLYKIIKDGGAVIVRGDYKRK